MAAYAALVSLMNLIEQIQNHPRPPITLDREQAESLRKNVAFLQDFLEAYNSCYADQEVESLRNHIADAAYAAEDVIESHVVDQLQAQTRARDQGKISTVDLYQGLQKVIQDMDFLKKEVIKMKGKLGTHDQLQRIMTTPIVSLKPPSKDQNIMVGFDDVLHETLDKLIGKPSTRQIIPIVGMGGIGKTTLARNIFKNQLIVERFDICSWVTITQEYNIPEILLDVLCQTNQGSRETLSAMSEEELNQKLYKSLYGRRYLIVMDDMWSNEVWDKIKFFFPDNNNGSRIIATTRLSNLALYLSGSCGIEMNFLDQDKSWSLLCKTVFGEEDCPLELEDIGLVIAKNCKGLPLSIVVIGGLLAKFKHERGYWEYIAKNLNSNVDLEENELCLKILYTSYEMLPAHLKACFLYMGVFPEDSKIHLSELIKLWVAEGFLKPISGKTLEEIAEDYLMDLIDRNLILVSKLGSSGKLKFCNIHDLLRDLSLRQAQKEKFLYISSEHRRDTPHDGIYPQCRRISVHQGTSKEKIHRSLNSELATRSLISYFEGDLPLVKFRLLRVLKKVHKLFHIEEKRSYSLEALFRLVNLRYLDLDSKEYIAMNPSSPSFWNLQTLIIQEQSKGHYIVPPEIWKMHQLRHVKFSTPHLLYPPNRIQIEAREAIVLENLQTLAGIQNFSCSEEVIKRIPNVTRLVISYNYSFYLRNKCKVASDYCLNNLVRLHKLESLSCYFDLTMSPCHSDLLHNLSFPDSLKKLTLRGTFLYWENMSAKIGALPHLQVLKLRTRSVVGPKWEAMEGQFPKLKYLLIEYLQDLEYWSAESIHFPCLEHLVLHGLDKLKEIPSCVGEMTTLQSIHLEYCSDSVIISAKQQLDEQEDLGNEGLHIRVLLGRKNDQYLESLASPNFRVETYM